MNKVLVSVADGTQARFLTLNLPDFPDEQVGVPLVELERLSNPSNEAQDEELWSSTKTGRNRGAGGQAHSYDDHRVGHRVEFERRFAQEIATHITDLVNIDQIRHLILVAEPQMIGLLRDTLAASVPTSLRISELTKNLCHLKPHELQKYLANHKLIPELVRVMDYQ